MSTQVKIHGGIAPAAPRDPAKVGGYPATLPIELALKTAPPADLALEYGYSPDEWNELQHNPAFMSDLVAAVELVRTEGMSFKLKARLQAEELLTTSWKMIHAPHDAVAPAVKADLIKTTFRVAGFDNKENAGTTGAQFNIQVNL